MTAVEWLPDDNTDIARIANWDNSGTIQALIEAGANVNFHGGTIRYHIGPRRMSVPEWQTTPLIVSGELGKYATLKLLLAHHADVNAVDTADTTILMVACGQAQGSLVEGLLKRGANVDARDADGRTALLWALEPFNDMFWHEARTTAEVRAVVGSLLRAGASVNIQDNNGETPLFFAHEVWHDPQLISQLRKAGAK
jgi:hypothetical protein